MMRTVKKVANSYNCESLEIANPSFLSLKNRGLANPSKVANREHCESLRAHKEGLNKSFFQLRSYTQLSHHVIFSNPSFKVYLNFEFQ